MMQEESIIASPAAAAAAVSAATTAKAAAAAADSQSAYDKRPALTDVENVAVFFFGSGASPLLLHVIAPVRETPSGVCACVCELN